MAFIPDEAFDRASELSNTAFTLYCLICRWRNHRHRNAILNRSAAADTLGIGQSQLYRLLAELKTAEWITIRHDFITPIVGDFSRVNKSPKDSHSCETDSHSRDGISHSCETHNISNQPLISSLKQNDQKTVLERGQKTKIFDPCRDHVNGYKFGKYDGVSVACEDCYDLHHRQETA